MNYIGKFISNFKEFYKEINSATLTGAIDVVVIQQEDGTFISSPFHVRFGKMGVLRSREKIVDIEVNGRCVDVHMKLGESGEAFFVEEVENNEEDLGILSTSPLPTLNNFDEEMRNLHQNVDHHIYTSDYSQTASSDLYISDGKKSRSSTSEIEKSSEFTRSGEKAVQTDPLRTEFSSTRLSPVLNATDTQKAESELIGANDDKKMKKKRKRKSAAARRRRSPSKDSSVSSTASDTKTLNCQALEEEIFQMEEDFHCDGSDAMKSVPRTYSLPQLNRISGDSDESIDAELIDEVDNVRRSRSYSISYPRECHPFSDGDFSPILSPMSSRPPSPKSDTEYEREIILKTDAISQTDESQIQWLWGELPNLPSPTKSPEQNNTDDSKSLKDAGIDESSQQKSVLGGMFRFMRKTKKMRHQPESEGIYLDDLNLEELDPEVAALYFPQKHAEPINIQGCDEDNESGTGPSLPHSPHSVEGAPCGPTSSGIDSDTEESRPTFYDLNRYYDNLAMSLCGGLLDENSEIPEEKFLNSLLTYDDYCRNPSILFNPDLVIKINKKYYNWNSASPLIMSLVMYRRPLPAHTTCNLIKENMPKKKLSYSSWFSWGRSSDKYKKSETEKKDESNDVIVDIQETNLSYIPTEKIESTTSTTPTTLETAPANTVLSSVIESFPEPTTSSSDRYKKSLRLSSEQINRLELCDGANEVMFSVTTAYQGTTRCKCHIYLWKHSDTIVISDIDGTITKSDVLGHILPIIGKDWAQSGVTQLFTKIKRNGYQFLYLSARPIGQARITREYLKSIRQGDVSLPEGPLLLSPTSLINALHTEVIVKNPEEFKKQCLSDIANLFPHKNPFYAGFGNKINDTWAYAAVGIPISRIFTINHKGELRHELTLSFQSSYTSLTDVCDHIFPPLPEICLAPFKKDSLLGSCAPDGRLDAAEYSSFVHWRDPLPVIEDDNLSDSINRIEVS